MMSGNQVKDAIAYGITNNDAGSVPVMVKMADGSEVEIANIELVIPDLNAGPGTPEFIGAKRFIIKM